MGLRHADARGILSVLNELTSTECRSEFAERTVTVLRDLIRADQVMFAEVDPAAHEDLFLVSTTPSFPWSDEKEELLWRYFDQHQHPLCDAVGHDGDAHLRRMSDVIGRRQLEHLELYQEVFHPTGIEYLTMMQLPWRAGFCRHIGLIRSDRDFTDRDIEVLAELQPHINSGYRGAYDQERARRTLTALSEATSVEGLGVVLLGPSGRITETAGQARSFLDSYFGTDAIHLPDELRDWIAGLRKSRGTRGEPSAGTYVVEREDRRLIVRFLTSTEGGQLLLEERRLVPPEPDSALGLTPREVEVLRLIAGGKTNREAARVLGIASNTVRKHLENAYLKLGVGTRTAAIAKAFADRMPRIG